MGQSARKGVYAVSKDIDQQPTLRLHKVGGEGTPSKPQSAEASLELAER